MAGSVLQLITEYVVSACAGAGARLGLENANSSWHAEAALGDQSN